MNTFLSLASSRFSVRKYASTPVEQEKIDAILEAARLAPTACNYQPQKIYVVRSPEARKAMGEICRCTFDAPVIFVVGYDNDRSAKGLVHETHDFGDTDAAIVTTHMMLEAADLGLGTCWVGMFKEAEVKAVLNIPENVRIRDLLPTGYPAEGVKPAHLHTKSRELSDFVEER